MNWQYSVVLHRDEIPSRCGPESRQLNCNYLIKNFLFLYCVLIWNTKLKTGIGILLPFMGHFMLNVVPNSKSGITSQRVHLTTSHSHNFPIKCT